MKYGKYFLLSALMSAQLSADQAAPQVNHENTNAIELMYVFNKSYIDDLNFDIRISQSGNTSTDYKKTPNFEWGEQGQITYIKKLPGSIYSVLASFTALHNHFDYSKTFRPDQTNVFLSVANKYVSSINVSSFSAERPINYYQRNQFNFYGLDLFVKADLKNTKHARFAILGGAIMSGYNFKSNEKANSYAFNTLQYDKVHISNTDYFVGPNAKIFVVAPFFNNHLELSLKAGFGFMMSYVSLDAYHNRYNASNQLIGHDTTGYSNSFRFAYQYDLMAQVAFCYEDFCLSSGLTQFYYVAVRPDNIITFGGPFIKASYCF